MLQLNWSHFKPEFAGKPNDDVEAHLFRTNDTHAFPEGVKVKCFCLTLVGEARLWYISIRPIKSRLDWVTNQLRQQYFKIGNIREQVFHVWRSFYFNKNAETLDSNVTCIRQVGTLLGYGKPQVLEVFKNTLPTRLYWLLFPTKDLRQTVETARRIVTKEKINRQLADQSFLTPFRNIKDGYISKRVTYLHTGGLGDKIDILTSIMSKLTAQDDNQNKQF